MSCRVVPPGRVAMLAAACLGVSAAALAAGPASAPPPRSTVAGRLDVHPDIWSAELGNRRRIFVLRPPGYDASRRHPVVYAADGQDLFDAALAAGGEEWAVDELLAAQPTGVPALLVVGIESTPAAMREYAPPGSRDDARGDAWVRFVADIVKPFVDRNYTTSCERDATLLLGEGPAAVAALYGAWSRPEVFGGAIAMGVPDLVDEDLAWAAVPPAAARPRLWVEQQSSVAERASTIDLVAALRRGAEVAVRVAGSQAGRPARLLAALRAMLGP